MKKSKWMKKWCVAFLGLCMMIYSLPLNAFASTAYDLWVNDEQITSDHLTVICGAGTAVYSPTANELVLTNAEITKGCSVDYLGSGILSRIDGLTISVVGDCTISDTGGEGISTYGGIPHDLIINGTGELTISENTAYYGYGIYCTGNLTIDGITLDVESACSGLWSGGNLLIKNSTAEINAKSVRNPWGMGEEEISGYGIVSNTGTITINNSEVSASSGKHSAFMTGDTVDESKIVLSGVKLLAGGWDASTASIGFGHVHAYNGWVYDDGSHWKECTDSSCPDKEGSKINLEAHSDADSNHYCDTCLKQVSNHSGGTASCIANAVCTVCGESYGELSSHHPGTEWKYDEMSHWKACSDCLSAIGSTEHVFGWVVDQAATTAKTGLKHQECTSCGYRNGKTEVIPVLTPEAPKTPEGEGQEVESKELPVLTLEAPKAPEDEGQGITAGGSKKLPVMTPEAPKMPEGEDPKKPVGESKEPPVLPSEAPKMLEGEGQEIIAGESKELSFRSDADISTFVRAEIDGTTIPAEQYTVKSGSTIVTLKPSYVATLGAGTHTLGIVSTSGTATADFTVVAGTPASSQTGENQNLLWKIALLMVLSILVGIAVMRRKVK